MRFSTKVQSGLSNRLFSAMDDILFVSKIDSKLKYLIVPFTFATITYLIDKYVIPGNKPGVPLSQYLGWVTGYLFWMVVLDLDKNK